MFPMELKNQQHLKVKEVDKREKEWLTHSIILLAM